VRITVDAITPKGVNEPRLVSLFTLVARDPRNGQAASVTTLKPETEEEILAFKQGAGNWHSYKFVIESPIVSLIEYNHSTLPVS
jgi:hypothetical protein